MGISKYDKRLTYILKRYGLDSYYHPAFEFYLLKRWKIDKLLAKLLRSLKDKNCGIFCDKDVYVRIKKRFQKCCFMDFSSALLISGTNDFQKEYTDWKKTHKDVEVILILYPHEQAYMVLEKLYSIRVVEKIVNSCDFLEANGVFPSFLDLLTPIFSPLGNIKRMFWQSLYYYASYSRCIRGILRKKNKKLPDVPGYFDIYCARQELLRAAQGLPYSYAEKKYISLLCEMRDFSSLLSYANTHRNETWVEALCRDLKSLFQEMQNAIKKRKREAIVWNWVDNVSYDDFIRDMPFLKEEASKSLYFPNTYTMMPWTSWTFKIIFSGKNVIRDKLFLYEPIGEKYGGSYPIYDEFLNRGYSIYYLGADYHGQKMKKPEFDSNGNESVHDFLYHSTEKQWRALTMLAERDIKLFLIIHNLYETHTPYLQPFSEHTDEAEDEKVRGRKYLDEQLKWYQNLMKKNWEKGIFIYMSDHGDAFQKGDSDMTAHFYDYRVHTFFMVNYLSKIARRDEFLSLKSCARLVLSLIDGKDYENCLDDHVDLECYDRYSRAAVEDTLAHANKVSKDGWMQYIGFRNRFCKYILYADGEERFYILPNEEHNCINEDIRYKTLCKELRLNMKKYIIDPYDYEFFKNSRKLYEAFGVNQKIGETSEKNFD